MPTLLQDHFETIAPSEADTRVARESSRKLAERLSQTETATLQLAAHQGKAEEGLELPPAAVKLLFHILTEMAQGNAVTLIPVHAELTTQQAADLLNVSRPYLIKLIDEGKLPSRKVGTHRRVLFHDLMAYKRCVDADRLKALEELSALDQELNLGY